MTDPNTEAEGPRVIGICQNPEGPQPWFQADSTDEKCPEPYCDCEPKFYVALRSAASSPPRTPDHGGTHR